MSADAVPTGNTFDKYGSTNPVVKALMAGFEGTLEQLFERAAPTSILDIGCGEAVLTRQWAARVENPPQGPSELATSADSDTRNPPRGPSEPATSAHSDTRNPPRGPSEPATSAHSDTRNPPRGPSESATSAHSDTRRGRVVGVDLDDPKLRAHWETVSAPNLELRALDVTGGLPYAADEFDLVCATEVLEHVPGPEAVVAEMARVSARHLLVSVPHEPLWRMLNVARGAYLGDLGNTPGHINHWTKRAFVAMLARHGEVIEARSPFPWTMLLVRVH